MDCGLRNDLSSTICRSLSAPTPPALSDSPSNGESNRYQSPLHAWAVNQTSGHRCPVSDEPSSLPLVHQCLPLSQGSPGPRSFPQTLCQKRLDIYIISLLQRKSPPTRSSCPRTSISAEASKNALRQAGLCAWQVCGPSPKYNQTTPVRQKISAEQTQNGTSGRNVHDVSDLAQVQKSTLFNKDKQTTQTLLQSCPQSITTLLCPKSDSSHLETKQPCFPSVQTSVEPPPIVKTQSALLANSLVHLQGNSGKPPLPGRYYEEGQEGQRLKRSSKYVSTQRHSRKNVKNVKRKNVATKKTSGQCDHERKDEVHHSFASKKPQALDDKGSAHHHPVTPSSSRTKQRLVSVPEGCVQERHTSKPHRHHLHRQVRESPAVVAKPKHKCKDYRQLRVYTGIPNDVAFREAQQQRNKKSTCVPKSPYAYVTGSDSEYSAECASLFHSTVADSSEDEVSNFTENRLGDSESSVSDSTTCSDTEVNTESGAGCDTTATRKQRGQLRAAKTKETGQDVSSTRTKSFVRIKASHNLKRKILRHRSGPFTLMTTM